MVNELNEYPNASKEIEWQRMRYFWRVENVDIVNSVYSLLTNELMYVANVTLSAKVFGVSMSKVENRTVFMPVSKEYLRELEARIKEKLLNKSKHETN